MKSKMPVVAVFVAIAICLAPAAQAQFETSDRSRAGVSLAVMTPSGSELKDLKSIWLGPTLDLNVGFDEFDRANIVLSFTWFGQAEPNKKANFFPLVATYIKRFGRDKDNPCYVGGGPGAYFVNYKGFEEVNPGVFRSVSEGATKLGLRFVVGKEYGGWFVEFRQDIVSSLEISSNKSIGLNCWSLVFGSRMAL